MKPILSTMRTKGLGLFAIGMTLLFMVATAVAATHRVAMSDFTADENEWDAIHAATDASRLIQTELAKVANIEWLERAQLGLAQSEIEIGATLGRDVRDSIRRARWNKADWLVTGRFTNRNGARELHLEVIDLPHADVLADRNVKLAVKSQEPLRGMLAEAHAMADALRGLFGEAERREREVAGLPVVAVLFFPDSAVFQRAFQAALADPKVTGGPLRVLRLPRAGDALGEAELVLGGFAEDAEGTWRTIADVYAWGSFKRYESGSIDGETITDAHTPTIGLTVWDGRLSPFQFVEKGEPVERREFDKAVGAQARRLAASIAEVALRRRLDAQDESQRKQISRALLRTAKEMEERRDYRAGDLSNPVGREHFFNMMQTLEAACFFDPQNREAQELFVRYRWNPRFDLEMKSRFHFQLGKSEAWGRFVDRFGLPEPGPTVHEQITALMRQRPVDHEKIRALMQSTAEDGLPIATEFLRSSLAAVDGAILGNREDFGYPRGVTEEAAASWADQITREVARRTLLLAGRKDADLLGGLAATFASYGRKFFYLRDPAKRVEVLTKVWPQIFERLQPDPPHIESTGGALRERIRQTFSELGNPAEAERLLSSVPTKIATPARTLLAPAWARGPGVPPGFPTQPHAIRGQVSAEDASPLFRMPPIVVLPPEVKPPVEKFEALQKAGVFRIEQLALLAGRVWLSGKGLEHTEIEGANKALADELKPTSYEATRLFSFDPAGATLQRVAATGQLTPMHLLAHDRLLWITLGKDGVAALDPASGNLRRFGPADGMNVASAYALAAADGRIFMTANMSDVVVWETSSKRWQPFEAEFPPENRGGYGGDVRRLSAWGPWVLLCKGSVGFSPAAAPAWTVMDEKLGGDFNIRGQQMIRCGVADGNGFWLGSTAGLHFIDPKTGEVSNRLRPFSAAGVIRPGVDRPPTTAEAVGTFLKRRELLHRQRADMPAGAHPSGLSGRIVGNVIALANDGDFLWVVTEQADSVYGWSHVMLLHKSTGRWVGQFHMDRVGCLAVDDKYLWVGCALSYGNGGKCLQRIEKRALYEIPQEKWVTDSVSDAEAKGPMERLDARGKALWNFAGGDYSKASELLVEIQPATPETLFLQGLCHDRDGLNEPEKARSFFQQIIDSHSANPLAAEARKQILALEKQPGPAPRR